MFEDVEAIARMQVTQYQQALDSDCRFVFFDTWLIITKVWFEWVYNKVPEWLDQEIRNCPIDLFLLCRPDLPWEADPVRENGGENRIKLYNQYKSNLQEYGFNFIEVEGVGENRVATAIESVRRIFE
jgi:nicotinamide riboside kinase